MAIKVLVVDDEPDVAVIFRQKFRKRIAAGEFDFVFAENGRQALKMAQDDPEISLVFTDIRMPSMDGLTFLKELRGLERQVLLPMVVSAYDDMPNIREAMRQGAWDFVTKPIDLDDLDRVITAAATEVLQKMATLHTAAQLRQAEQDREWLQRSKEMQQQFFENITHELRTPLTLVLAPLESALGLSSETQVLDYLHQAKKSGRILLDLVQQLLDLAKVDAHMLQPQSRNVHLSPFLGEMAALFEPLAHQKNLRFETHLPAGLAGRTDPRMLGRILLNLLSNAFKFTPRDGKVTLDARQDAGTLTLQVMDTGAGISAQDSQAIFSRFQQGGNTAPSLGTGLGLSLCKALAELLGGSISLTSTLGQGSTFTVQLPLPEVDSTELATGLDATWVLPELDPTASESPDTSAELPLVLVAEDHPDMRHYIAQVLQGPLSVVTAENGLRALEKAKELIPDLIVTDWMMPEMTGLELLGRIRHDRDTHHIPVVLLTARSEVHDRIAGAETGAEAFLGKPFHPEELKAVVNTQLARRDRLRERFRMEMLRPDRLPTTSMDDQFLADVKRVMEKNLMNEQFGVETMADALAMSRRTLVRKLTAITGQAPVKFIRSYRLERALQMLQNHTAPIWEIAVKTGFGSASYFTKCFKDHYGKSPKEAMSQNQREIR